MKVLARVVLAPRPGRSNDSSLKFNLNQQTVEDNTTWSIYATILEVTYVAITASAIRLFVSSCKSRNVTNEISLLDLLSGVGLIDRNECGSNTNNRTSERVIERTKRNEMNDSRRNENENRNKTKRTESNETKRN